VYIGFVLTINQYLYQRWMQRGKEQFWAVVMKWYLHPLRPVNSI